MTGTFFIQGLPVNLYCERGLFSTLSTYFNSLCQEDLCPGTEAIDLALEKSHTPFPLPDDAVREIKGPTVTYYSRGDTLYFRSRSGSLISLDPVHREAKGFITDDILNTPLEFFSFVSEPLVEMLKYSGLYSLHGAALRGRDMSVLVTGESGSGKTSTSLSLVENGFKYVSDDTLFIQKTNESVNVYPLYKSFNINQDIARRFPQLFNHKKTPVPKGIKIPIDISKIIPDSHLSCLKPEVIIFPRIISSTQSSIRPIGSMEAYRRLLSQIILALDKNVAKKQLHVLELLVKQTRGFEMLSAKDLYENPGSILNMIDQLDDVHENG